MNKDHLKIGIIMSLMSSAVMLTAYYFTGRMGEDSAIAATRTDVAVLQSQQVAQDASITELKSEYSTINNQLTDLKIGVGSITDYFKISITKK